MRFNHLPGECILVFKNFFSEEISPDIQSESPLVQLEAITSCPIPCYLDEETIHQCHSLNTKLFSFTFTCRKIACLAFTRWKHITFIGPLGMKISLLLFWTKLRLSLKSPMFIVTYCKTSTKWIELSIYNFYFAPVKHRAEGKL